MTPEEARRIQDARLSAGYDWCPDDMHDALEEDMAATIAALRWEYGVEVRADEHSQWQPSEQWFHTVDQARAWRGVMTIRIGCPYADDRLVRRLVGPVEVVE